MHFFYDVGRGLDRQRSQEGLPWLTRQVDNHLALIRRMELRQHFRSGPGVSRSKQVTDLLRYLPGLLFHGSFRPRRLWQSTVLRVLFCDHRSALIKNETMMSGTTLPVTTVTVPLRQAAAAVCTSMYNVRVRVLIVSDIHGNAAALEAVFTAAEEDGPLDEVWCLGDIVGYGPDPMACLERLWEANAVSICGNHDAGVVGRIGLEDFSYYAAIACRWTRTQITDRAREYLTTLPLTLVEGPFTLVHGSPRDPLWEYVFGYPQAIEAWDRTGTHGVLLGHTHFQFACEAGRGLEQPGPEGLHIPITHARLVINPGSVGQPRDHDPRAAYAVYDDEAQAVTLKRAWYDISVTQRAMAEAGLPEALISRLSAGT